MAELVAITTLLVALAAGGFLAHVLRMPPPLGYLAVGVASTTLGEELLPHATVDVLAEVAVLVLLFWIGLELDLRRLREALRKAASTIPFDIPVPALLIAGVARLAGWTLTEAFALGIAASVSSTLFGERLASMPGVSAESRQRVVGVLITEDVVAGALIALLVALGGTSTGLLGTSLDIGRLVVLLVALTGVGLLMVPRLLDSMARRHTPDLLVLWTLAVIVTFGFAGMWIGSAELGALLAGVAAAEAGSRYVARNALQGLRDVAGALFFFGAGLAVDLTTLGSSILLSAGIAVVFIAANIAVHTPAALASGLSLKDSAHAAFALATFGEFSLILMAVSEDAGVAHPSARTVLVGAMLILLPVASVLMRTAPGLERAFWRAPARYRKPLVWIVQGVRRKPGTETPNPRGRRAAVQRFLANLVLVIGWAIGAGALQGPMQRWLGGGFPAAAAWFAATVGIGVPLLWGMYRAYRDLVWRLVGLRPGEREGAGRVRARLVDAWATATAVLALIPIALIAPQTLPVLLAGGALALIVTVVAWRGLARFHATLEGTLARVLGADAHSSQFLDSMLDRYPWGVRFSAVSVPPGSPFAGQTLLETRLSSLSGATVAVIQRAREELVNPSPDTRLRTGDTLVLVGDMHQLARAESLIVAHGDAVRMSAQSMAAQIEEIPLTADSPWDKKTLGEVRIREATGSLVIGVWEIGDAHPRPYSPDIVLDDQDRLILLGTPLQLQRARALATGTET